jgi:hypothetical protein
MQTIDGSMVETAAVLSDTTFSEIMLAEGNITALTMPRSTPSDRSNHQQRLISPHYGQRQ